MKMEQENRRRNEQKKQSNGERNRERRNEIKEGSKGGKSKKNKGHEEKE
jgi:hypothetical protein